MEVTSLCELPVASLLWQPRPGAWMLTFVCKATFELHPGESPLAHAQEPVYESDQHWSNDPAWSLYAPRDIVPIRPRADVVLVGHAFAPNETPMRSLVARLVVADIEKAIEVWCDRSWSPDGTLNEGPRFVRMPIVYERAAAGPDAVNPVGLREGSRDRQGKRDLPNLQPVGAAVKSPSDLIEPVGFGPIAASWGVRQRKLGRHAGTWDEKAFHQAPLPHDIDASYFNVAPRDQQTTELKSGARLVLDNLHPEHWHLVTALAAISPHALVERPGQGEQNVAMRPDLLWIHTDRGICTLTFRGQIPIEHPLEKGAVKIALEDGGAAAGWEEIEPEAEETTPGSEGTRVTMVPQSPVSTLGVAVRGLADAAVATASGLPFAPVASPAAHPTRPSPAESRLAHTPFAAEHFRQVMVSGVPQFSQNLRASGSAGSSTTM